MGSEQSRPSGNKQAGSKKISVAAVPQNDQQKFNQEDAIQPNEVPPDNNHNTYDDNDNNNESKTEIQKSGPPKPGEIKSFRQLFSDFELDVLFSTWPLLSKNPVGTGCLVFKNAFEIHPKLRNFFAFGNLSPEELLDSPDLKIHSAKVMRVIHKAVEALNGDSKSLYEELVILGAKHAAIADMKIEYFKIIKEAILMTWGRLIYEEFTDDVRKAWGHVLDEVVAIMTEGCLIFEEEEEKMLEEDDTCQDLNSVPNDEHHCVKEKKTNRTSVATVPKEELAQIYPSCK
uniref:Globin domain-containing protein n=1 Tax=Trichobilharzia regenti TaxID=157069 RepID=A0AA85JE16_TRIRE|nr:unnamed protein product [Trichobilharzia regenti]